MRGGGLQRGGMVRGADGQLRWGGVNRGGEG